MIDINQADVYCLCDWDGLFADLVRDKNIDGYFLCPKCDSPDWKFVDPIADAEFSKRQKFLSNHLTHAYAFSDTSQSSYLTPETKVVLFINIHNAGQWIIRSDASFHIDPDNIRPTSNQLHFPLFGQSPAISIFSAESEEVFNIAVQNDISHQVETFMGRGILRALSAFSVFFEEGS